MSGSPNSHEYPAKAVYMVGSVRHQVSSAFIQATLQLSESPADEFCPHRHAKIYWRFSKEICRVISKDYQYFMAFEVVYTNMPWDVVFGKVPRLESDISYNPFDAAVKAGFLKIRTSSWNKIKQKTKRTTSWASSDSRSVVRKQRRSSHSTVTSPCQSPAIQPSEFQALSSARPLSAVREQKAAENTNATPITLIPTYTEPSEIEVTGVVGDLDWAGNISAHQHSTNPFPFPGNALEMSHIEGENGFVKVDTIHRTDPEIGRGSVPSGQGWIDSGLGIDSRNKEAEKNNESPDLMPRPIYEEIHVQKLTGSVGNIETSSEPTAFEKWMKEDSKLLRSEAILAEPNRFGQNSGNSGSIYTHNKTFLPDNLQDRKLVINESTHLSSAEFPEKTVELTSHDQQEEVSSVANPEHPSLDINAHGKVGVPYAIKQFLESRDELEVTDAIPKDCLSKSEEKPSTNTDLIMHEVRMPVAFIDEVPIPGQEFPIIGHSTATISPRSSSSQQDALPGVARDLPLDCHEECRNASNCQRERPRPRPPHIEGLKRVEPEPGRSLDLRPAENADEYWVWDEEVKQYYHVDSENGSVDWYEDSDNEKIE
jgi:hypothetical protein